MLKALTIITASLLAMTDVQAQPKTFIGRQTPKIVNRQFTPEALWAMGRVGGATVAPDNKTVVYNVSYYSVEENKSHTVIYKVNSDGTGEQLLTTAKTSELSPKFIKNGTQIAFLGADAEGTMQLWAMNPDGTGRIQLTKEKEDVEDFTFSPDEKKVILVKSIKYGKRTSDLYPDLQKASGRVINDLMHRHWDEWVENIPHSFVGDFDGTAVTNVKDILEGEPYECPMKPFGGIEQLAWSTDSKTIAYTCRKLEGRDYACSTDADIYLYDVATGKTKNICKPEGYVRPAVDYTESLKDQKVNTEAPVVGGMTFAGYDINPSFSPDGKYIAWQSMRQDGYESDINRLIIMDLKTGNCRQLAADFDSNVESFTWSADSKKIYFNGVWHGEIHIYSADVKTGASKKITEGEFVVARSAQAHQPRQPATNG